MSINNLFPTIIVFLYLVIIFLLGFYKKLTVKNKLLKFNPKNVDIPIAFYCYNNQTSKDLFYLTLLNLIDKNYYKLYKKGNCTYIEWTKENIGYYTNEELKNYEMRVIRFINQLIYKDSENNFIEINQLEFLIKTDFSFNINLTKFTNEIKEDAKEIYGSVDKFSDYNFSILFGIFYFMQMLFFIYNKFAISQLLVISIPLTFITIAIADKIKNKLLKFNFKRIAFITIISLIIAMLSCVLWINLSSFNYLIFHFIMALLTFMHPLFLLINVYLIKTNTFFLNEKQKNIVDGLNLFLEELLENPKKAKDNYVYSKGFSIKIKNDNKEIEEFAHLFGI